MIDRLDIASILSETPTAGLTCCANPDLAISKLAELIADMNRSLGEATLDGREIRQLAEIDYRRIATEVHRRKLSNDVGTEAIRETLNPADLDLKIHDFRLEDDIMCFLERAFPAPGHAIESAYDLPGINAVFRDGLVKVWQLPSGTAVISKRENPSKPGRFRNEQSAIDHLFALFGCSEATNLSFTSEIGNASFRIHRPLFSFHAPDTAADYAVWRFQSGSTLDQILLNRALNPRSRRVHLQAYRDCLQALFDKGIVWRDMSPRNIIVSDQHDHTYHLVDFEKAEFRSTPLSNEERIDVCRDQFFIEELCVLCEAREIDSVFGSDLFDPADWPENGQEEPVDLFALRPELRHLLSFLGIVSLTRSELNRWDKRILAVRQAYTSEDTGETLYPGSLGFRVEHYLSMSNRIDATRYDTMTTDILLAAAARKQLERVGDQIEPSLNALETALLLSELRAHAERGTSRCFVFPVHEAELLCAKLEQLHSVYHLEADDMAGACG